MLSKLPKQTDPNVLIGFDTADDAGVYQLAPDLAFAPAIARPLLLVVGSRYDKLARSLIDALHIAAIRSCTRHATL